MSEVSSALAALPNWTEHSTHSPAPPPALSMASPGGTEAILALDAAAERMHHSNAEYQSRLMAAMDRIARAQQRTVQLQTLNRQLLPELEGQAELKIEAGALEHPTLPWFKHYHRKDLNANSDGVARELYLAAIKHTPWNAKEKRALRAEIEAQNRAAVTLQAQRNGANVAGVLSAYPPAYFTERKEDIDWDAVAATTGLERRSGVDCQLQWLGQDHPKINKAKWSKQELDRLKNIIDSYQDVKLKPWPAILAELGTQRNVADCVRQYRNVTRPFVLKWTAETDEKLAGLVQECGQNWQLVARQLGPGFSSNGCIDRWKRIKPDVKQGPWTELEDALLRAAHKSTEPGSNYWSRMAHKLGNGRSEAQCRERWVNFLNPSLLPFHIWSQEEDTRLLHLRDELKLGWAQIAKEFNGTRTDAHCSKRHRQLSNPAAMKRWLKRKEGKPATPRKPESKKKKKEGTTLSLSSQPELTELDAVSGGDCLREGEPNAPPKRKRRRLAKPPPPDTPRISGRSRKLAGNHEDYVY